MHTYAYPLGLGDVMLWQAVLVREISQVKGVMLLRDTGRLEGMHLLTASFPSLSGPPADVLRSLVMPILDLDLAWRPP